MTSLNCTELPNPFNELAFLPPDIAFQTQITRYILVGTLAAFIWDIISNSFSDYRLLFKHTVRFPTLVYFVSRIVAFSFCLLFTLFYTTPTAHCATLNKAILIAFAIAVPATCLLFFIRIRAIFDRDKYIVLFFFLVWLSVLGCALTVVPGVKATNIGPTDYCIGAELKSYVSSPGIAVLIHDSFVFIAISTRILSNSQIDRGVKDMAKAFFSGHYIPTFSKTLLQDGQIYYLVSIGMNLLGVIMVYASSVPEYRLVFISPNVMLTNAMACQVFRSTMFGVIKDTSITTSSMKSSEPIHHSLPLTIRQYAVNNGGVHGSGDEIPQRGRIEIVKTVDYIHSYPDSLDLQPTKET